MRLRRGISVWRFVALLLHECHGVAGPSAETGSDGPDLDKLGCSKSQTKHTPHTFIDLIISHMYIHLCVNVHTYIYIYYLYMYIGPCEYPNTLLSNGGQEPASPRVSTE